MVCNAENPLGDRAPPDTFRELRPLTLTAHYVMARGREERAGRLVNAFNPIM